MATIWDKSHGGRLTIPPPMGTLFTVQHRSGKCKAHIRWNKDVGANLTRAMVTGRGKLMQRIIRDTHPLVPFDTGMLDNSAQLGEGLHGDTGLRGSYWAERSKDANKVSWNQFWKAVMKEETR